MNDNYKDYDKGSFPPWSRIPSIIEMSAEIGVDHDRFIEFIQEGKSPDFIAAEMEITVETVRALYDHFMRYGIGSVMGGD